MTSVDASAELFDPDKLPRFDITLSQAAITSLTNAPGTYVHAGLRYGTTTLADVAVRIKGEASQRTITQKAAFKIKTDEFVGGQTLLGLKRVTLNNMAQDPTFLAERLAYHVYRAAGLPAPRCNSALVYVNDDFYGVYANVESEDKTFLHRYFSNATGNLYEDAQVDFEPGNEATFTLQTNETVNDRSDLQAFTAAIAAAKDESFLADMDATLDTAHFLKWTAVEGAVNQWDEYSYTYFEPNNFRLYHDPASGKFTFLPWGMDLAMKPFVDGSLAFIPLFQVPIYENKPGNREAGGLVFKRCLASPGCKSKYAQVLAQIADLYDAQKLDELAAQYYAQIKDHVYEDWRKEYSNQEFETAYQALLGTIRGRTAAMRSDLKAAGF
jgi:spore coat protein CotH